MLTSTWTQHTTDTASSTLVQPRYLISSHAFIVQLFSELNKHGLTSRNDFKIKASSLVQASFGRWGDSHHDFPWTCPAQLASPFYCEAMLGTMAWHTSYVPAWMAQSIYWECMQMKTWKTSKLIQSWKLNCIVGWKRAQKCVHESGSLQHLMLCNSPNGSFRRDLHQLTSWTSIRALKVTWQGVRRHQFGVQWSVVLPIHSHRSMRTSLISLEAFCCYHRI